MVHGDAACDVRTLQPVELARTGPYVPPITFPGLGCVVVVDSVKRELESSGLTGVSFVKAIKRVVVPLAWHEWDWSSADPAEFPEDGEPASYLTESKHSPLLAEQLPSLWHLAVAVGAEEFRVDDRSSDTGPVQMRLREDSLRGYDFFRGDKSLYHYVSPGAREWLLSRFPAWVAFKSVQMG